MSGPPPTTTASSSHGLLAPRRTWRGTAKKAGLATLHHIKKHTGVGVICAVAYFDPGNWGVDLQAGSQYGYRLLFVVLLAGLFAVFLQVLASRLGCVTGIDLASHSRLLLYNRPKHTLLYRWLGLYPLYVLAEIAIIATDLAELLGSAIALCMLFPKLQLWHGVLITSFDVILLLAVGDPLRGRPVRMFELMIAAMVLAVLICMIVIISKVDVHWGHAFQGYIPSKYIFQSGGLYTSVGILGATIMPHSLFIGSALATQDRIEFKHDDDSEISFASSHSESDVNSLPRNKLASKWTVLTKFLKSSARNAFRTPPASFFATQATRHSERENNPFEFVHAHLYHGIFDVVASLLGFAVLINSLILILAAAVFYYGDSWSGKGDPASLFDAYDLIRDIVGKLAHDVTTTPLIAAATLFAIALLSAGQSSSLIATVAGQAVSQGFLQWRVSPIIRRLLTRLLAIIPSMVVAVAVGRRGIDTLLVASQVVLSVVLPFITFPLLFCTSSKSIMTVRRSKFRTPALVSSTSVRDPGGVDDLLTVDDRNNVGAEIVDVPPLLSSSPKRMLPSDNKKTFANMEGADADELVDFSNNKITIVLAGVIWLVIVAANIYVLVDLGRGGGV